MEEGLRVEGDDAEFSPGEDMINILENVERSGGGGDHDDEEDDDDNNNNNNTTTNDN